MSSNRTSSKQISLTSLMKIMNYQTNDSKVCRSLAYMAVQQFLGNDFSKFEKRLQTLSKLSATGIQQNSNLGLLAETKAFFKEIELHLPSEKEEKPDFQKFTQFSGIYSEAKINELIYSFFFTLKNDAKLNQKVILTFNTGNYIIALGYDFTKNQALLIDTNQFVSQPFSLPSKIKPNSPELEELAKAIQKAFSLENNKELISFATHLYAAPPKENGNKVQSEIEECVTKWRNRTAWVKLHTPTESLTKLVGINSASWLFLALMEDETDTVLKLIELTPNLASQPVPNPYTSLLDAAVFYSKNKKIIEALLKNQKEEFSNEKLQTSLTLAQKLEKKETAEIISIKVRLNNLYKKEQSEWKEEISEWKLITDLKNVSSKEKENLSYYLKLLKTREDRLLFLKTLNFSEKMAEDFVEDLRKTHDTATENLKKIDKSTYLQINSLPSTDFQKFFEKNNSLLNMQDEKGKTLLHMAVEDKSLDLGKNLLIHGANPNIPDNSGHTPLHKACESSTAFIEPLLKNKADPNLCSKSGKNASHYYLSNVENKLNNLPFKELSKENLMVLEDILNKMKVLRDHGANINDNSEKPLTSSILDRTNNRVTAPEYEPHTKEWIALVLPLLSEKLQNKLAFIIFKPFSYLPAFDEWNTLKLSAMKEHYYFLRQSYQLQKQCLLAITNLPYEIINLILSHNIILMAAPEFDNPADKNATLKQKFTDSEIKEVIKENELNEKIAKDFLLNLISLPISDKVKNHINLAVEMKTTFFSALRNIFSNKETSLDEETTPLDMFYLSLPFLNEAILNIFNNSKNTYSGPNLLNRGYFSIECDYAFNRFPSTVIDIEKEIVTNPCSDKYQEKEKNAKEQLEKNIKELKSKSPVLSTLMKKAESKKCSYSALNKYVEALIGKRSVNARHSEFSEERSGYGYARLFAGFSSSFTKDSTTDLTIKIR